MIIWHLICVYVISMSDCVSPVIDYNNNYQKIISSNPSIPAKAVAYIMMIVPFNCRLQFVLDALNQQQQRRYCIINIYIYFTHYLWGHSISLKIKYTLEYIQIDYQKSFLNVYLNTYIRTAAMGHHCGLKFLTTPCFRDIFIFDLLDKCSLC